jgi:hypothetical protein
MIGAVNYGSGKRAFDPLQTIAGKTGTCIGQGSWLGLFASYAPVQNPNLAIVVVTRGPDARRHFPAYVAGQIYRSLKHRFATTGGAPMPYAVAPRPKINPNAAAEIADEERDDEAAEMIDNAAGEGVRDTTGNGAKSVIMTVPQTKPTGVITRPVTPPGNATSGQSNDQQRPRRVHATRP